MTKEQILELKETQETINKLFRFTNTSLLTDEVLLASYKLSQIIYKDRHYKEVVNLLVPKLNYFEHQKENDLYLKNVELIIKSFLKLKDKKNASYYIELKRNILPHHKMDVYYRDILKLKKVFNEDYLPVLNVIDNIILDKGSLSYYYIETFKRKIEENAIDVAVYYNYLMTLNFHPEDVKLIDELYLQSLYDNSKFHKLEEILNEQPNYIKAYFQTLSLINDGQLLKVQLFEAENEKEYYKLSASRQKNLYNELKEFYSNKDKISYQLYKDKYDKVEEVVEDLVTEDKYIHLYTIPKKQQDQPIIETLDEEPSTIQKDKDLEVLDKIINEIASLKAETTLFNKIRSLSIVLETYLSFSDIIYNFNGEVYHYKKERLYEKDYDKHTLEASILGISANNYLDIIEEVDKIKYNYDILTNKPLTESNVKQVYCFGLVDKSSVCFYQSRKKNINTDKELFKVISNFIAYEIMFYNKLKTYDTTHQMTQSSFYNNDVMMFVQKKYIEGNKKFKETFKLNKHDDIESLISYFPPNEQREYISLLQALRRREITSFSIEVTYEDKKYLVTNYINDSYTYGIFTDITNLVKEKQQWKEKAFVNPISNILTLHEFEVSFESYSKDKNTFFLIELNDLEEIESLFGKQVKQNYLDEFTNIVKKHFDVVYQFDLNSLLAVLHKNDVRAVENQINKFYSYLNSYKSKVLDLAQMDCFIGVIRYPIQTKEKHVNKIYQYLSLALLNAKRSRTGKKHEYFSYDNYQQDLFETEILRQIDRLIVDESLDLTFNQIINQQTNKVYAYQVGVYSNSLSVYEAYYYEVARKRGLLNILQRYIIKQTFSHLKTLFETTGHYIKVVINISKETLTDDNFKTYLLSLIKIYNIPTNIIEFVYDGKFNQKDNSLLKDLFEMGFVVGVTNNDFINQKFIKRYHYTKRIDNNDSRQLNYVTYLNSYCKQEGVLFIVYHVNDDQYKKQLQENEVVYIRGKVVDKVYNFNEILKLINEIVTKELE